MLDAVRQFPARILGFLAMAIWRKLVAIAVGAALGALVGFNWDDIDAWVRYWVQPGNIGGAYVIKSRTYDDDPPYPELPLVHTVDLKHGGTRVFGVIKTKAGPRWKFNGYLRSKFMAFSYGGLKEDGLGTGTYSMQIDVADIFWGYAVKVECLGPDAMYARCPAVMYRKGYEDRENIYRSFLDGQCEKVILKKPDTCIELKSADYRPQISAPYRR